MKDIFKLYINGNLVDFEQEVSFPVTYQQEDFSNPTIIKNSFSKTIKIEGTDNNNKIFGEIYNLDREQLYKFRKFDGAYFDPSKRTPFALYKNAELIQSGYMQLSDISIKDLKIVYNITLYGGLGDFFYSLMYNDDGEKKTLADLYYKIEDSNGNVLPKDTELNFRINKDFVASSWNKLKSNATGKTINDFICFAPSYNGLYENFSNSSYLVNTFANQLFMDTTITDNGVEYKTYEGYLLAKTEKEFTEWEVRDLRSYMQRPCIRFKKLFESICDEDNNGGYKVILDETFFNSQNPYYEKAYMALPLLKSATEGTNNEKKESDLYIDYGYWGDAATVGTKNSVFTENANINLSLRNGEFIANQSNNFIIDMDNIPFSSTIDIDIDFSLDFDASSLNSTVDNSNLYLTYVHSKSYSAGGRPGVSLTSTTYNSLICQISVYDASTVNGKEYRSNVLNFTSPVTLGGTTYTSTPDKWVNNNSDYSNYEYTNVFGKFVRQGNTNKYKWVSDDGYSNFYINLKDVPKFNKMGVKLMFGLRTSNIDEKRFLINKNTLKDSNVTGESDSQKMDLYLVSGYSTTSFYNSSKFTCTILESTLRSDAKMDKKDLLKTEFSPCDVLLDYCKLFGLYFTKDIHSKTINILTKNNFFNGNIIDISDKIDHSQEMKIKPYLFATKYYLMKNAENETYYSKMYSNEYNLVYGQKRIDTNYNFNKDTQEIYEGSIFQNAISVTDTSPYYKSFYNGFYNICPCWMTQTVTLTYYKVNGTSISSFEQNYGNTHWIDYNKTESWNIRSGYDIFPKTCFYSVDNNSKSLTDISSTLLFFNGFKDTVDASGDDSSTVPYWLTDDIYQMLTLNNNEVCYLHTESPYDLNGNTIGIKYEELPQFLRYYTNGNNVIESFDFGVPKELYIPSLNYVEDSTLYNKFWKKYLSDRYDVNTRKVTCYVNFEGININQDSLKNFYYFNNCLWVINKIENYVPNAYKTTKVEFVKVNTIENYTNAQYQYTATSSDLKLSATEATVDWNRTKYTVDVTSTTNWTTPRLVSGYAVIPTSGEAGTTSVELVAPVNNSEYIKDSSFKFTDELGNTAKFTLTQIPSSENAKFIYGYVYNKKTQQPLSNVIMSFRNELGDNYDREIELQPNTEGYYEVWLPKSLCDSSEWIWLVIYDNDTGDEVLSNMIEWENLKYKQERDFAIS